MPTTQNRLPTSNGGTSEWLPFVGSNNTDEWSNVDDPIGSPNDDTDYIYTDGNKNDERLEYTNFSITSTSINKVSVTFRSKYDGTGGVDIRAILYVNVTRYLGSVVAQTTSYAEHVEDWATNPDTAAAWVEADVEGTGSNPIVDFGVRNANQTGGVQSRVTQCYISVEYEEAGGGGQPMMLRHSLNTGARKIGRQF